MNKRGFTLIELLASIIILSIIMLIAVPSTLNILDRSRKQQYLSDAKKMLTLAEGYIRSHEEIEYPKDNEVLVLKINTINDGSLVEDPEGNPYSDESFVTVSKKNDGLNFKYEYKVHLLGVKGTNTRGVNLANISDLSGNERYKKVEKGASLTMTNPEICSGALGTGSTCVVNVK